MLSSSTSLESTRKRLSFRLNKLRQQKIAEPLPDCWICSGCARADPVPRAHHFPDLRTPCRAKFAHDRVGRFISAGCPTSSRFWEKWGPACCTKEKKATTFNVAFPFHSCESVARRYCVRTSPYGETAISTAVSLGRLIGPLKIVPLPLVAS